MKIVDLNILLYAVNKAAPHHAQVRGFWEAALADEDPVGLSWPVLSGFLRLSTRAEVFPRPFSVEAACRRIDRWLALPSIRIVTEQPEHWRLLRELLEEAGTAGNLTSDAHLAALAISYGATLCSCDSDFARFAGLRWLNPLRA